MSLFRRLKQSFSWPLALTFLATGTVVALLAHFLRADFDRRGFVESSDGLRLAYEVQGQGPPLVLLAGGPGMSHHVFHPHLGLLRRHATVIYFDPRGRGDSDEAPTYRVANDVRDLEALRSGLELTQIDLLGLSYGAHLAAAYSLEYPDAVRKLVLVSPIVGRSAWKAHCEILVGAPGMKETLARIEEEDGAVLLSDPGSRRKIIETLAPLYWCEPSAARLPFSVLRPWHRVVRQNFGVYQAIVGEPFGTLNGDLAESRIETRLSQIQSPTLLMAGACDRVVPQDHLPWLENILPRAHRRSFLASGHSPYIDEPQLFAQEVAEFLGTR